MTNKSKYGFQGHLSSEFPSQIVIDVTEFCNLACIHCPHEELSKTGVLKGNHLSSELHKKLIDEVARDGRQFCKYLRYTAQGETLLHPNFMEMIAYAGENAGVPINITTNGMLLSEKKAKALLDAGVSVLDISIDAYKPETYEKIRKNGDLSVTRSNVVRLIEEIKRNKYETKIVVSFVEQELNKSESKDFESFWKYVGADYVVIRRLHSAGGAKKGLVSAVSERYPCLYPWERLTLAPDGCIHFCAQDWIHASVVCDFSKTTIKEVWQGEFMEKLRNAHLKNEFQGFDFCRQCPDWSTTRWPDEGKSYSDLMKELVPSDLVDEGE